MRSRCRNVAATPAVVAGLLKGAVLHRSGPKNKRIFLLVLLTLLSALTLVSAVITWNATAAYRAQMLYRQGDYNASATLFASLQGPSAYYNAAGARYRAGAYEEAYTLYNAIETPDTEFASRIWYNMGNTLVRLKEFEKARKAYAHSLTLQYDDAAFDNMMHILHAEAQDHMLTGRQEGKKRAQDQADEREETQTPKQKEGGGSNQPSAAERTRGAGSQGKKAEREPQLEFSNKGKSRLSTKQYELINKRSVHEKTPW